MKKITIEETTEIELTEREESIYRAGKVDGFIFGAVLMTVVCFGFMIAAFAFA